LQRGWGSVWRLKCGGKTFWSYISIDYKGISRVRWCRLRCNTARPRTYYGEHGLPTYIAMSTSVPMMWSRSIFFGVEFPRSTWSSVMRPVNMPEAHRLSWSAAWPKSSVYLGFWLIMVRRQYVHRECISCNIGWVSSSPRVECEGLCVWWGSTAGLGSGDIIWVWILEYWACVGKSELESVWSDLESWYAGAGETICTSPSLQLFRTFNSSFSLRWPSIAKSTRWSNCLGVLIGTGGVRPCMLYFANILSIFSVYLCIGVKNLRQGHSCFWCQFAHQSLSIFDCVNPYSFLPLCIPSLLHVESNVQVIPHRILATSDYLYNTVKLFGDCQQIEQEQSRR